MTRKNLSSILLAGLTLAGCGGGSTFNPAAPATAIALTNNGRIFVFPITGTTSPTIVPLNTVSPAERLSGIDKDNATGTMYGIGSNTGDLYARAGTGQAFGNLMPAFTAIGSGGLAWANGPGRLELSHTVGAETFDLTSQAKTPSTYVYQNGIGTPAILEIAFAGTTLYGIDKLGMGWQLVKIANGVVTPVNPIGGPVPSTNTGKVGFDISGGTAYLSVTNGANIDLYTVDLTSGFASPLGTVVGLGVGEIVTGLAIDD